MVISLSIPAAVPRAVVETLHSGYCELAKTRCLTDGDFVRYPAGTGALKNNGDFVPNMYYKLTLTAMRFSVTSATRYTNNTPGFAASTRPYTV